MKQLSSRTAGFTDSVIRRMTRISNQYGAINHLIRFHFAKRDETLNGALNRLCDVRKKFPNPK